MAFSIQRAVSDGTMTLLPISIEYFDREEISVAFNGVLNARQWAWVGTTDKTLSFTPAVAANVEVMVVRSTDLSELRHQFSLGAQFTAESLDESLLQVLHIAQEATERQLGGDFFTDIDMHGSKITNLGAGVAPGDAVNTAQLTTHDAVIVGYKDAAAASAAAANVSAVDAKAARDALFNDLASHTSGKGSALVAFMPSGTGATPTDVQTKLREFVSVKDFGAVGDGVADDTAAWGLFESAVGTKYVPAGNYLVGGVVREFPAGCLGWGASLGSDFHDAINTNDRSAVKLSQHFGSGTAESDYTRQVEVSATVENTSALVNPTRPVGIYAKHTQTGGSGTNNLYSHSAMFYARNSAVGDNDVIAVSGRAHKDNISGGIGDAAGVWGSAYQYSQQDGGVMASESSVYQNVAGNTAADRLGSKWAVSHHINSDSIGSAASAGIAIDSSGEDSGKYGYWNGIIIDRNAFAQNGAGAGIPGTVGVNCGSWDSTCYPEIGWKIGNATWHIYRGNAAVYVNANQLSVTNTVGGASAAGMQLSTNGTGNTYLDFKNTSSGNLVRANAFWSEVNLNFTLGTTGTHSILLKTNDTPRIEVDNTGHLQGYLDNTYSCGTASKRWSVIYSASGTINTSDARAKQQVRELSDAERAVALRCKGLLRAFKFNDAVASKGDLARVHFGIIAQDVKAAFEAEGLSPTHYGVFCHDTWDDQYETITDADGASTGERRLVLAAGERYGIRYDQLFAFILAAL